jgi:hypothetical protein
MAFCMLISIHYAESFHQNHGDEVSTYRAYFGDKNVKRVLTSLKGLLMLSLALQDLFSTLC